MEETTRCHLCGAPDFAGVTTCKRCGADRRAPFDAARAAEAGPSAEEAAGPRPRPRPAPRAVPTKDCPTCLAQCADSANSCPHCGHRFPGVRARYIVVPLVMALILALFAAVRYFDEKAKETRIRNLRAGVVTPFDMIDPATGQPVMGEKPTPQKPWFSSWFRGKPTAEEIFAHNLEVSGGAEAVARIRSHSSTGTLSFAPVPSQAQAAHYYGDRRLPPPARMTVYAKSPDKMLTELEMGPDSQFPDDRHLIRRGFDGRRGWEYVERYVREPGAERSVKQAELRELAGAELEHARHYSGAGGLVRLAEQFSSLVMLDNQKVSRPTHYGRKELERECYVVRGLNREDKFETFYFDIDTGLLLRFDFETRGPDGPATIECYPEDYREVSNVLIPFRMSFKADDVWVTVTLDHVKLNDTILDSVFEPPAS